MPEPTSTPGGVPKPSVSEPVTIPSASEDETESPEDDDEGSEDVGGSAT
jgi:hypothetical protein